MPVEACPPPASNDGNIFTMPEKKFMTKIGPSARRLRAVHPHFALRFCGGVCLALAWLAAAVARGQTLGTTSLVVGPAAGTNSVALAVTPQTGVWTATANTNWLQLSAANQSGQGSTNVVFTFSANTNATRSGTLTIAGQTLTVTQAGSTYVAAQPLAMLVSANLNQPSGVAVDGAGNVYVADTGNSAIKEWSATGNILTTTTLVASNLNHPLGVAVDGAGNVYIADTGNSAIKKWSAANSNVTTLVSSGLLYPYGLAVDGAGNVYIADTFDSAIKKWSPGQGSPTTLVSTGLNEPHGVAVDAVGNVYIADTENNAIKKWSAANSNVTTLVPSGLSLPAGVAVDGSGNVYIADTYHSAIKEWVAAENVVTSLVSSNLFYPAGVAVDGAGNVYMADTLDNALKELPYAFVDPSPKLESQAAGNDALPEVLPATENLLAPFTPTSSDMSWLTVNGSSNGVVSFSFAINTTGASRMAGILLLGQSIPVTQTAQAPSVTNLSATNINSSNATLNASVNPQGSTTTVYFVYGATTNYGSNTAADSIGSETNAIPVSAAVSGLLPAAVYHFEAIAFNSAGTNFGGDMTFTTQAGAPLATTQPATSISLSNATLNASVTPEGTNTTVYFVYGATTNYGATNIVPNIGSGTGAISVDTNLTGLLPATLYHFEAIASSSEGTNFGGDLTFTTLSGAPLATTLSASNINYGNATLYASITPENAATTVYFVYGPNTNYGSTNVVGDFGSGSNAVSVSATVTGLLPGAQYHFEAIASSSEGTALGGDAVFSNSSAATYSLGLTSLVGGPAAGSNSVVLAVTPQSGAWTATANTNWLQLSAANTNGTGSANVVFSYQPNTNAATRSGTLTIAGQTLTFTQAGSGYVAAQPVTSLAALGLAEPLGVAVDAGGNVYFADSGNNAIKEWVAANNTVATLVSSGLAQPWGVAVDAAGNVYFADSGNNAIKKWSPGQSNPSILVSSNATTPLNGPRGVAVDGAGNVYIADTDDGAIKEWKVNNTLTNLVSSGLSRPGGVAVDIAGNVYIADSGNNAIKEWSAANNTTGTLVSSNLDNPSGVAVDGSGNVYIADTLGDAIIEWMAVNSNVITLVSSGLFYPSGVAVDGAGNVYIANTGGNAVEELPNAFVDTNNFFETNNFAGNDHLPTVLPASENLLAPFAPTSSATWLTVSPSVTNGVVDLSFTANTGPARAAAITVLGRNILFTQAGDTFFLGATSLVEGPAAGSDSVVLAVNPNFGAWTVIANNDWLSAAMQNGAGSTNVVFSFTANPGATRTGTLTIAGQTLTVTQAGSSFAATGAGAVTTLVPSGLLAPFGVAVDSSGNVYIADSGQSAIKKWTAANNTVANLVSSGLSKPRGVAVDGPGNVYISDYANNAVYEWPASTSTNTNTLTPLVSAGLFNPLGVTVDGAGNVYIADYGDLAIKEFSPATGNLITLVSSGLLYPSGVAVDAAGNVYFSDTGNNAIKKWSAADSNVTTLASGLAGPSGVAVDGAGNVYFADTGNNAIKEWSAANNTLNTLPPSGLSQPWGVAVDSARNVYFANTGGNTIAELPYAFVDTTPKFEADGAGSDLLPAVLPAGENLLAPFTPASSANWLTISNGAANFYFTLNANPGNRTASITMLGQSISVTQGTNAITNATSLTLDNLRLMANGVLQFTFTNNPNASFTVLSSTNLALPLSQWTTLPNALIYTNGALQFTSQPTTNDAQLFYLIRSP
jgi:DNA-binding beta-propeller fold protein YncE